MVAGATVGARLVMVKFKVTTESHPPAFTPIHSNVVEVVDLIPFQMYTLHAVTYKVESVSVQSNVMVKFNLTVESQPTEFTPVHVAVLLDDV
jgi:hypothetical protein